MDKLHIAVCVKVVPKPEEIRVNPETHTLDRTGVRSEINPPDMNALEIALRLKDHYPCHISILSMGPPLFTQYLRVGLAMGADHIYLLSDRAFGGADTLATTYTLAKGIEQIGNIDLVICGEESSDGATGQVPSGLAEWLNIPQITLVNSIEIDILNHTILGRREFQGGYETLSAPLPALISVKTAANEPRFMDYRIKQWAFDEAEITIWDKHALPVDESCIGMPGSPTIVSGLDEAETRERKRIFLEGTPAEIAHQLADILQNAAAV